MRVCGEDRAVLFDVARRLHNVTRCDEWPKLIFFISPSICFLSNEFVELPTV